MIKKSIFIFIVSAGLTFTSQAMLLTKDDIYDDNCVRINVWKPKFLSTYSHSLGDPGHTSLEIIRGGIRTTYISLRPEHFNNSNVNYNPVAAYSNDFQKQVDDCTALISINGTLLGNCYDEFYRSINHFPHIKDNSSLILYLLKKVGLEELFPETGVLETAKNITYDVIFDLGTKATPLTVVTAPVAIWTGLAPIGWTWSLGTIAIDLYNKYGQFNFKDGDLSDKHIDPYRIARLMNKAKNLEEEYLKRIGYTSRMTILLPMLPAPLVTQNQPLQQPQQVAPPPPQQQPQQVAPPSPHPLVIQQVLQ